MWDSLSPQGSSLELAIAAWSTAAAAFAVLTLFAYTLGLRVATIRHERRRRDLVARWRTIFAAAAFSGDDARRCRLPPYARRLFHSSSRSVSSLRA